MNNLDTNPSATEMPMNAEATPVAKGLIVEASVLIPAHSMTTATIKP